MNFKIKTIHALLVGVLVCALNYTALASTYNNGIISMTGNGDTWSLNTQPSGPFRITHVTIVSSGGAKSYHLRYGTTSTSTRIWGKTVNGTAGTTSTVEVDYGSNAGGIPLNATKDLYLSTDDADPTGTLYLYTTAN